MIITLTISLLNYFHVYFHVYFLIVKYLLLKTSEFSYLIHLWNQCKTQSTSLNFLMVYLEKKLCTERLHLKFSFKKNAEKSHVTWNFTWIHANQEKIIWQKKKKLNFLSIDGTVLITALHMILTSIHFENPMSFWVSFEFSELYYSVSTSLEHWVLQVTEFFSLNMFESYLQS